MKKDLIKSSLDIIAEYKNLVIVPAFNEEFFLPKLFKSIESQIDNSDTAVLVIINNSIDNSVQLVEEWIEKNSFPMTYLNLYFDHQIIGKIKKDCLNVILTQYDFETLIFIDADSWFNNDLIFKRINSLTSHISDGCWVMPCDEFGDLETMIDYQVNEEKLICQQILSFGTNFRCSYIPKKIPKLRFTNGTNTIIKSSTLSKIGSFSEKAIGEDFEIGEKFKIYFNSEISFLNEIIITSIRKPISNNQLGGFVFYPIEQEHLECIRSIDRNKILNLMNSKNCLKAIGNDLVTFMYFVCWKYHLDLKKEALLILDLFNEFNQNSRGLITLDLIQYGKILRFENTITREVLCYFINADMMTKFLQYGVRSLESGIIK